MAPTFPNWNDRAPRSVRCQSFDRPGVTEALGCSTRSAFGQPCRGTAAWARGTGRRPAQREAQGLGVPMGAAKGAGGLHRGRPRVHRHPAPNIGERPLVAPDCRRSITLGTATTGRNSRTPRAGRSVRTRSLGRASSTSRRTVESSRSRSHPTRGTEIVRVPRRRSATSTVDQPSWTSPYGSPHARSDSPQRPRQASSVQSGAPPHAALHGWTQPIDGTRLRSDRFRNGTSSSSTFLPPRIARIPPKYAPRGSSHPGCARGNRAGVYAETLVSSLVSRVYQLASEVRVPPQEPKFARDGGFG
jgi:hypothetical protein